LAGCFFGEVLADAIEAVSKMPAATIGNLRWTKLIPYFSVFHVFEQPWRLANCLLS
jgi:hypothetical protein